MPIRIHPHARERMAERGATEDEVTTTISEGERFSAKFGRAGFRRNFPFDRTWRGRQYATKQVEAYVVQEGDVSLVITVIVKYLGEKRAPS